MSAAHTNANASASGTGGAERGVPLARAADAVHAPPFERIVFDCDSTLARIEGIEELSRSRPPAIAAEIAELTEQAMSGRVPMEEVYARRLQIVAPRRNDVATLGRRYIEAAVPQVREVMAALKLLGKELRVVSGGLRLPVVTFAGWLGIEDDHVHAVQAWFDGDSRLSHFDRDNPLTRSGGKQKVLGGLPKKRTVLVGDGMTDAEARDAVDCFVCYAGVVRRPEVAALAHAVVDGNGFASLLPALCSPDELERLKRDPRHGRLIVPRFV